MKLPSFLLALVLMAALLSSQPAPREVVGLQPGGNSAILPNGWRIQPAGKQVPLSTFPMSSALSPDGRYLLVLNGGYRPPSVSVIEVASAAVVDTAPVADGWLGLTFTPKGDRVYVGGGSQGAVFEFAFAAGKLTPARTFPVVDPAKRTNRDFIGDVALSPDGHLLYAADLYRDAVVVINPQSGMVIDRFRTGRRPYRILFHPDGKSYFVTHWADGNLGHYDTATGARLATVRIGAHPTDMVWRAGKNEPAEGEPGWVARLFVAAANTNNVYAVAVSEAHELNVVESINIAMTPRQPVGMTPSALGLSPDGNRLFTVCSDANAVAVADISGDRARVLGFVPSGWYPTAARMLASGTLVILNGRGLRSYPNPNGPSPLKKAAVVHGGIRSDEYGPYIQTGTASFVEPFTAEQLAFYTGTTFTNSPYRDARLDDASPLPKIDHVIYIVKENRTYDQMLGDLKQGNGDPSLVLFPENVTPNHHKLAREFVLFDNFYVNSDVSADGHSWSTAAIAPDYVQKMWPNSYAGRRKLYDYEGQEPANSPPAGYLWTNALAAGLSVRNFGYFVTNKPQAAPTGEDQIDGVRDPGLAPVTNRKYRAFDLSYPDRDRAQIFLSELAGYEKSGQMPRLIVMRLGNDHTSGTTAGKIAPLASVADNDYALGLIVEGVSKSPFWASTAIFVLEDDAQNGADHVDSHRSPAFVISPYIKRHVVDGTLYNTTSVLRTMEFLLGLRPMTHFDAGARPMTAAFQSTPNAAPYVAEKPRIALDEVNPATSPTAARSARLKFDEADEINDDELNDILWRAIRKDDPPAPVRSYFAR
jgi:DNA-binding beta-propeller fold protein YncE